MTNPLIVKYARPIMAYMVILLSFGVVYALIFKEAPAGSGQALYISVGVVLSGLSLVLNYYFGTSKDKSDQDQQQMTVSQDTKAAKLDVLQKGIVSTTLEISNLLAQGNASDSQIILDAQAKLDQMQKDLDELRTKP